MNNNTLGIIGIVAGSVVALGGIAGIALQKRANAWANFRPGSTSGGDAYGIILQLKNDDPGYEKWNKLYEEVLLKKPPTYEGAHRDGLYRVRHFIDGNEDDPPAPTPPSTEKDEDLDLGKLSMDHLLFDRGDVIAKLAERKFTGYAFQIGVGRIQSYETLGSKVDMPQGRGKLNAIRESRKMVEEINDILSPDGQ